MRYSNPPVSVLWLQRSWELYQYVFSAGQRLQHCHTNWLILLCLHCLLCLEQSVSHCNISVVVVSLRTSSSVFTAEGEHGPRRSSSVPSRRRTPDPPAAGGGQRPYGVPSLLCLWTVPAIPGRHGSASISAKRTLICQVSRERWDRIAP